MRYSGDNVFQCDSDPEVITITFRPTSADIAIEYIKNGIGTSVPVEGNNLTVTVDSAQIDLDVFYLFPPGSTNRCRIFLKGETGPRHENRPAAQPLPLAPEHRMYTFMPFAPNDDE